MGGGGEQELTSRCAECLVPQDELPNVSTDLVSLLRSGVKTRTVSPGWWAGRSHQWGM